MPRAILTCILLVLLIPKFAHSQIFTQSEIPNYTYYPPDKDKMSWQRLNLWLSSTFINVVNEGQIEMDSCLYLASRSLGLSRFSFLGEGMEDPELYEQAGWVDRSQPEEGIHLLSKATGKNHVQLLILLGSYYAFKPLNLQSDRDSSTYYLTKAIEESSVIKEDRMTRLALCLLGKAYIGYDDKKVDSIYNVLFRQCQQTGDKETEARALGYRGIYTFATPAAIPLKITDLQKAAALYRQLKDTEGEINVLTDIGFLLVISGQLDSAYEIFFKAFQLAEAIRFPYIHYNAHTLSMVTIFQSKFGEPLKYTLLMIKVSEACRDSIGWGYFHSSLAQLLRSEGRYKESLEVTQKAVDWFVSSRNPTVFNLLLDIINHMHETGREKEVLNLLVDISKKVRAPATYTDQYFYHNAFATCYLNLDKLDSAEMHIKKMDSLETIAEAYRGPLRRSSIQTLSAIAFFKRGQYQKARENFEKHFTIPSAAMRNFAGDLQIYRWLLIIDSVLGDNKSEIAHFKKYSALLDSNFQVTKIRQAEELQLTYQTQEKENQIASLTRQAELEKANSHQARLVKNLTLAGIVAALIIAGLLYRQNRLKQKSNGIITRKNEQLQNLLADKEWLLKEIHHRVKNNLQIVMSLLNSQSVYIDNDAALTAIRDSQRRMHAMALIHQKLYLSENISSIAMREYINELIDYVVGSLDVQSRILFEKNIEPVDLDVSQAIPLGLIINESIVNAIKYAFPKGQKGMVSINLRQESDGPLWLRIADNGIGLPPDIDLKENNSLGFNLMQGLTKQLNGIFTVESNNGLHITIRFVAINKLFPDSTPVKS